MPVDKANSAAVNNYWEGETTMERITFLNKIAPPEHPAHCRGRLQAAKLVKRIVARLAVASLVALGLTLAFSGRLSAQQGKEQADEPPIGLYSSWLDSLFPEFRVVQGNIFLMTATDCPTFITIFQSCFGNNPAAPYIIPQPPVEDSYVDPHYAKDLNTPGPNGKTTNIIYRLSDHDALVTIVSYPPKAAYLGYISYVFTSLISNYARITPPAPPTKSPDPNRYDIFGSIGNDVNDVVVQNQLGVSPWNNAIVAYITTSNENLANALTDRAKQHGIDPKSIFIEPIGSNVITGNGREADDMVTLMRYAIPRFVPLSTAWTDFIKRNVLVYKVSNPSVPVQRYGANSYTRHVVNTDEKTHVPPIQKALQQLATLLTNYLAAKQFSSAESQPLMPTTKVNLRGVPDAGLVGSYCIQYGIDCLGDDQDTSTYALLRLRMLGAEETAFVVGVNHNRPDLDNTRYVSVGIYDSDDQTGVAAASQTNPQAVGFDRGSLNGSAKGILDALRISVPADYKDLKDNLPNLYVAAMARDINNPTIAHAKQYTINLRDTPTRLPLTAGLLITERSYIVPSRTAGGNVDRMLYPLAVAATRDFESSQSTEGDASR
jgi:hypothetical protein